MNQQIHRILKASIILFLILISLSCKTSYNDIEFMALQDITNEYLVKHDLFDRLHSIPPPPPPGYYKYDSAKVVIVDSAKIVDSLKIQIYISDGLMPIAQIKEDDQWLFRDSTVNKLNDSIYLSILNSRRFTQLKYYEFKKNKLNLVKPYYQIFNIQKEVKKDDNYIIFNFSRICFNSDYSYGLVLLEFSRGYDSYYGIGELKVCLIQKINNHWKIIND